MIGRTKRIGLVCATMLLTIGMAQAAAPPAAPASAPVDAERLVLARQIVAIAMPDERTKWTVDKLILGYLRPIEVDLRHRYAVGDPVLMALVNDYLAQVASNARAAMQPRMPAMSEAMARAYARLFSSDELVEILAFARTPAGARWLDRSSDAVRDSDVAEVYADLFPAVEATQAPLHAEFARKLAAYLDAHPAVQAKTAVR